MVPASKTMKVPKRKTTLLDNDEEVSLIDERKKNDGEKINFAAGISGLGLINDRSGLTLGGTN